MSEIIPFSFFEDSRNTYDDGAVQLATGSGSDCDDAWKAFFLADHAADTLLPLDIDMTGSIISSSRGSSTNCSEANGSDLGMSTCTFDIDNAFIDASVSDPVMKADDFAAEVDYMFERRGMTLVAANDRRPAASPSLELSFDITDFSSMLDNTEEEAIIKSTVDVSGIVSPTESESDTPTVQHHTDEFTILASQDDDGDLAMEESSSSLDFVTPSPMINPENMQNVTSQLKSDLHSYAAVKSSLRKTRTFKSDSFKAKSREQAVRSSANSRRKQLSKKLYEVDCPLADPDAERCRLNAINAKRNRDRKKAELDAAHHEIGQLRRENRRLREAVANSAEELADTRAELDQIKQALKAAGLPVDEREE